MLFRNLFFVLHITFLSSANLIAQQLPCTSVNPDVGPLGYKARIGDTRCEGMYRSPVAGLPLELLSLTLGPIDFQLRPDATLYVAAPDIGPLKVDKLRLQARALRLSTYYRMDALIQSGATFRWPMSLLHPAKLTRELIGVVGWVDQNATKLYVPISVSESTSRSVNGTNLVAILRSSVDLEKLFWRRWPEGKVGASTKWENTASTYRGGQPIRLEFQASKGVTIFELSAKTTGSDDWASVIAHVYQP
jgi:hypothetical protein